MFRLTLCFLSIAALVAACGPSEALPDVQVVTPSPTATPIATATPVATATPTPLPTPTPGTVSTPTAISTVVPTVTPPPSVKSVSITPSQDATIYEEGESLANGGGRFLFAGKTNTGNSRRALLLFDVAGALPANVSVQSVILSMSMDRSRAEDAPVNIHRLTASWSEGDSKASGQEGSGISATGESATWMFRAHGDAEWSSDGGDYAQAYSATTDVGGSGSYDWADSGLTADVQSWLDTPSTNHGWIVIGDESSSLTAKRFASREGQTPPTLTIDYVSLS